MTGPGGGPGASVGFYKDGPYILRGEFEIVGQDGVRIDGGRRTVALCRCGKSRIRPFCDGTHRIASFRAAGVAEGASAPVRPAPTERAAPPPPRRSGRPDAAAAEDSASGSEPMSEALAWIYLAHEVLVAAPAGPTGAADRLAMRLAEPLVRAAWALVETRTLQPLPSPPPELVSGGLPTARAFLAAALGAVGVHGEDPVWGTVHGLLRDACAELDGSVR